MKKDIDVKCYELTLTPNYVSDWTFNDALRELIQNGTDQEVLDKENKFQIIYNGKEKTLRLVNQKSVLKINTLLLGRSSKANNEDTVGQFGEGYKIAALVLNRLGKTFTIYNNEKGEIWESRFKNSEKWLEKILAFYVYKHDTDNSGLCIEVGNVTHEEFNNLYKVWLHLENCDYSKAETGYGEIILDEEYAGEVYVNGLFVDCNSDLKYGYNFKPKYIRLERDRKTCLVWYCCSGAVWSGRFLSAPALLPRWVRVEDVIFTFRIKNINLCHCDTSRPAVPGTLSLLDVFRLNHPMYISNDSRPASLPCNNSCKYIFPTAISFLPSILAYRTACRLRFCPYQSLQFFDEVSDFHLRFWRKFFSVNVIPSIEFIL